ncbi:MAG TPA: cupin domain-containing protein [Candidatus Binataceae bacterium]|nr:cupin domain-containing protein [Candidatus Binataceae bacterium]
MEDAKEAVPLLDVEKRIHHASRPGLRIAEFTITPMQKIPWHCHSAAQDTFLVLEGQIRLFLRDPKEEVRLAPGETRSVLPKRPHLVTNGGETAATFLVIHFGEYDFIPLT